MTFVLCRINVDATLLRLYSVKLMSMYIPTYRLVNFILQTLLWERNVDATLWHRMTLKRGCIHVMCLLL